LITPKVRGGNESSLFDKLTADFGVKEKSSFMGSLVSKRPSAGNLKLINSSEKPSKSAFTDKTNMQVSKQPSETREVVKQEPVNQERDSLGLYKVSPGEDAHQRLC